MAIRKKALAGYIGLTTLVYGIGEKHAFPDGLAEPLIMNEHAQHPLPGVIIGCVSTWLADKAHLNRKVALGVGVGITAVAGVLFELGAANSIYRHNTPSWADGFWTTMGGILGAFSNSPGSPESAENTIAHES